MNEEISAFYRVMTPEEVELFHETYEAGWRDDTMPERQYRRVVADELVKFRAGEDIRPYTVALECLRQLPPMERPALLDVGAASGYYSEVLKIGGFQCRYRACDFSPKFKDIAERLFPGILFDVCDARDLPYGDNEFDIVLHGAVLMHIREFEEAIAEAARVSKRYVIFHRTPIQEGHETRFFAKEAYGIPCMEIWFNPEQLQGIFARFGLTVIGSIDLFKGEDGYGHRSYICEKGLSWHPV